MSKRRRGVVRSLRDTPCAPPEPLPDVLRRFLSLVALLCLALSAPMSAATAQQVDVIRGRITGADNEPLDNVAVVVTSISGNVNRTARTDRAGRFTVTFPGGDGDYLVSVTALGYSVKRFEVKRGADEDILIADAKLSKVGAVLDAVKVTAAREKVSRNDVPQDVGGTERVIQNNRSEEHTLNSSHMPKSRMPSSA